MFHIDSFGGRPCLRRSDNGLVLWYSRWRDKWLMDESASDFVRDSLYSPELCMFEYGDAVTDLRNMIVDNLIKDIFKQETCDLAFSTRFLDHWWKDE